MSLLEISQLQKSFVTPDGAEHTVVNVSEFHLAGLAQVALEGESGSGKTTFLHLIAGILKPDAGTITLAGRELSALSEPARDRLRATSIGYIFQTFNLLQGYTCLENALLGMSFAFAIYGVIVTVVAGILRAETGVVIDPWKFNVVMPWAPVGLIALGALAGIVPAWKAYRTDVAQNLSPIS